MNTFELGCAILSAAAYVEGRNPRNQTPRAPEATPLPGPLGYTSDTSTGFEASAYEYQGRIVIAFAGTGPQLGDGMADAALGLGFMHAQLRQAADFYEAIKAQYGADRVTFTGHSLGGGLASLMAVFFNKPAVVFDAAPFRLAATMENAADLQEHLSTPASSRPAWGTDSDLAAFTNTEQLLLTANPALFGAVAGLAPGSVLAGLWTYPTNVRGESEINSYAVRGEFLSNRFHTLSAQNLRDLRLQAGGATGFIEMDVGSDVSRGDLHAIALLVAAGVEPGLADLAQSLPDVLRALFDESLYTRASSSSQPDILNRLLQHEFGSGASTGVIARLVADLQRLGVEGSAHLNGIREGLIAATLERYYFANASSTDSFLQPYGNGVRFDVSTITGSDRRGQQRLITSIGRLVDPAEVSRATTGASQALLWTVQRGANGPGMRIMGGSAVVRTHNPVLKSLDLSTSQCA